MSTALKIPPRLAVEIDRLRSLVLLFERGNPMEVSIQDRLSLFLVTLDRSILPSHLLLYTPDALEKSLNSEQRATVRWVRKLRDPGAKPKSIAQLLRVHTIRVPVSSAEKTSIRARAVAAHFSSRGAFLREAGLQQIPVRIPALNHQTAQTLVAAVQSIKQLQRTLSMNGGADDLPGLLDDLRERCYVLALAIQGVDQGDRS